MKVEHQSQIEKLKLELNKVRQKEAEKTTQESVLKAQVSFLNRELEETQNHYTASIGEMRSEIKKYKKHPTFVETGEDSDRKSSVKRGARYLRTGLHQGLKEG